MIRKTWLAGLVTVGLSTVAVAQPDVNLIPDSPEPIPSGPQASPAAAPGTPAAAAPAAQPVPTLSRVLAQGRSMTAGDCSDCRDRVLYPRLTRLFFPTEYREFCCPCQPAVAVAADPCCEPMAQEPAAKEPAPKEPAKLPESKSKAAPAQPPKNKPTANRVTPRPGTAGQYSSYMANVNDLRLASRPQPISQAVQTPNVETAPGPRTIDFAQARPVKLPTPAAARAIRLINSVVTVEEVEEALNQLTPADLASSSQLVEELLAATASPETEIRLAAVQALRRGEARSPVIDAALTELAETDPARSVRHAAQQQAEGK